MRQECQVMLPDGICGKPSVDSLPDPAMSDGRFWLCADHWDELNDSPDADAFDDDDTVVEQDTGYDDTDYDAEDEIEEDEDDEEA